MPISDEEARHDVEVLRKGATAFEDLAQALGDVYSGPGDPYHVPDPAWSGVGQSYECRDAYRDLRDRMDSLVENGRITLSQVGGQIRQAADRYEQEEILHVEQLRKVEEQLGEVGRREKAEWAREFGRQVGDSVSGGISDFARSLEQLWASSWDGDSGPVPDPDEGRAAADKAWIQLAPILDLSKTLWPALDGPTREVLDTIERAHEWSQEFWRIGEVANAWNSFAERLEALGIALGDVTGLVRLEWRGPAAEALEVYVTHNLQPRLPALAQRARDTFAALTVLFEAYRDFWRQLGIIAGTSATGIVVSGLTAGISGGAAVGVLATTVAAFTSAVANLITKNLEAAWATDDALRALNGVDLQGFDGNSWPQPGGDLGDGSRHDGDASDWTRR